MSEEQPKTSLTAKVLAISAIGMIVGFGTCGVTLLTTDGRDGFGVLESVGASIFFLSFVFLVGTILVFIANMLRENFRK